LDHHCRQQVSAGLGYKVQNGTDDHALREWHLGYVNHPGAQDGIHGIFLYAI